MKQYRMDLGVVRNTKNHVKLINCYRQRITFDTDQRLVFVSLQPLATPNSIFLDGIRGILLLSENAPMCGTLACDTV